MQAQLLCFELTEPQYAGHYWTVGATSIPVKAESGQNLLLNERMRQARYHVV